MRKKSKAEEWIILETTIGCLFLLAGSIIGFYLGIETQSTGDENYKWMFLAALFCLLMIPIIILSVYKRYFRE
ncbi:hypothetical protein [Acholeplasma laidlawii]|uniref:hypothetical protein n=1 Tax=Acholeplasma laidlawii TaxID=2148 RepID=UPI0021F73784|nr:hypothetical protein [Acholeplasma laidlawii]